MPCTTYTEEEVNALIRVAYTTGLRDALNTLQGHPLSEEQAAALTPFVTEGHRLAATVEDILRIGRSLTLADMQRLWREQSRATIKRRPRRERGGDGNDG